MKVKLLKKVRSKYWIERNPRTKKIEVHTKNMKAEFLTLEAAFQEYRVGILEIASDKMPDSKRRKIIIKHAQK